MSIQSFYDALAKAGITTPVCLTTDGQTLTYNPGTSDAEIAAVQAVFAAWDPASPSWTDYQATAAAALAESDKTVLRCGENQIPVPADWATYRKALRAIVGATTPPTQIPALPTRPDYPPGT